MVFRLRSNGVQAVLLRWQLLFAASGRLVGWCSVGLYIIYGVSPEGQKSV